MNRWKSGWKRGKELSLEDKKQVIRVLSEHGTRLLVLSGGEPLLYPKLIELVSYAYSLGMDVLIQTNGLYIDKDFLCKVRGKVIGFEVSLEGTKEAHEKLTGNSFDVVVENIKLAKSHGFNVFTNFTITRLNHLILEDYISMVKGLGVDVANFTRLYLSGNAIKNKDKLLLKMSEYATFLKKLDRQYGLTINMQSAMPYRFLRRNCIKLESACCEAGRTEITVYPNGSISYCPSWPYAIGNILDNKRVSKRQENPPGHGNNTGFDARSRGCLLMDAKADGKEDAEKLTTCSVRLNRNHIRNTV